VPDLAQLQEALGYRFRDRALLELALTHPSVVSERSGGRQDNQRLEFLGDAVLGLILSRELYDRWPEAEEGALTQARARLVNWRTLAEVGSSLGLGEYLILSRGEEASGGRRRPSALSDAFEAVVGAVYLDGGLEAAREVVLRHLADALVQPLAGPGADNPKGELQELLQAENRATPRYRIEEVSGPDHARRFECSVHRDGVELGRGCGPSKKDAETQAARAALQNLRAALRPPASPGAGQA
jgi:ribonuclease-3